MIAFRMVEEMTVDELHGRLEADDDPRIIDIRVEQLVRSGHVQGASTLRSPGPPSRRRIDWDDAFVVVCSKGESSLRTARLLESYEDVENGARIANLTGHYGEQEYELVRDT